MTMRTSIVKPNGPTHTAGCDGPRCDKTTRAPLAEPWVSLTLHDLPGAEPRIRDFCSIKCLVDWGLSMPAL